MTAIYCNPRRLEQALEKLQGNENYDRLKVLDTDCVLRGITLQEMQERNIRDYAQICSIEDVVANNFKFKFHQGQIADGQEFCFRPPKHNEIDADYCPSPGELGGNIRKIERKLQEIYSDIIWDFAKVSAASIASPGHLTDFEFEYEMIVTP